MVHYDSKYKKVHIEKPPTPAPSHLVPSTDASNVISFFCAHPEITCIYKQIYFPVLVIQMVVFYTLYCALGFFHLTMYLKFFIKTQISLLELYGIPYNWSERSCDPECFEAV